MYAKDCKPLYYTIFHDDPQEELVSDPSSENFTWSLRYVSFKKKLYTIQISLEQMSKRVEDRDITYLLLCLQNLE